MKQEGDAVVRCGAGEVMRLGHEVVGEVTQDVQERVCGELREMALRGV